MFFKQVSQLYVNKIIDIKMRDILSCLWCMEKTVKRDLNTRDLNTLGSLSRVPAYNIYKMQ